VAYQIMRIAKLKTAAKIVTAIRHNVRTRGVPNADPKRAKLNTFEVAVSEEQALARWRAVLPEKRRSDAVTLTEVVITASPGAFSRDDQWRRYLEEGVKYFTEKHGAENVVSVAYHWDETTPHVHVLAVPMIDGRLSQKALYGAGRKDMATLQTKFHEAVAVRHGLERGVEKSSAKHQDVRRYYGLSEQERETKRNALAKAQQERAAVEYRVSKERKLAEEVAELNATVEPLRKERDAAREDARRARGEVVEIQRERDAARALIWAANEYHLTLPPPDPSWIQDPGVRTEVTKINDALRRQGHDIGRLQRGGGGVDRGLGR